MRNRNWRHWFGVPRPHESEEEEVEEEESNNTVPETTPEGRFHALQMASGSRHQEEPELKLKKRLPPRCVGCKKFMSSHSMHIFISSNWLLHTKCFDKVVERYLKDGEVIDLTTGETHKVEDATDSE